MIAVSSCSHFAYLKQTLRPSYIVASYSHWVVAIIDMLKDQLATFVCLYRLIEGMIDNTQKGEEQALRRLT